MDKEKTKLQTTIEVKSEGIDETIKKLEKITHLLKEANSLADELASKFSKISQSNGNISLNI